MEDKKDNDDDLLISSSNINQDRTQYCVFFPPLFLLSFLSPHPTISAVSILLCAQTYAISYPVNNLLMGSGSQIIVPAEEQRADKGKLLAYEDDRQRAFDEHEAGGRKRLGVPGSTAGGSLSQI